MALLSTTTSIALIAHMNPFSPLAKHGITKNQAKERIESLINPIESEIS